MNLDRVQDIIILFSFCFHEIITITNDVRFPTYTERFAPSAAEAFL